MLANSTSC